MSYERCSKHNLMNCIMCAPRAEGRGHIDLPAPLPAPVGWSPEDALNSDLIGVAATPEVPDNQALEALERQKQIAKGEPVEVDFGDGPNPQTVTHFAATVDQKVAQTVFSVDPRSQTIIEIDPIVQAAKNYTDAQKHLEELSQEIKHFEEKLLALKDLLEESADIRDAKKEALQKLVMG